jgi:hypothetical protein
MVIDVLAEAYPGITLMYVLIIWPEGTFTEKIMVRLLKNKYDRGLLPFPVS